MAYKNPVPTVDIIIRVKGGIILIERKNPPFGWALPGGFVDYGESLEQAAVREAKEETSLDVNIIRQFHTYSDPSRDERLHTITTVFIAESDGKPEAADDAKNIGIFDPHALPENMAFDHADIISNYIEERF